MWFGKGKIPKQLEKFANADDDQKQVILSLVSKSPAKTVESTISLLQSGVLSVEQSNEILMSLRDRPAFEGLLKNLKSGLEIVRSTCFTVIRKKWSPKAIPEMINLLGSDDAHVRAIALDFLKEYPKKIPVREISRYLKEKDRDKKRKAVEAITGIGDKEVVDKIRDLLKTEEDHTVTQAAINALEALGSPSDAKLLLGLLKSDDIITRQRSSEVIQLLGDASIVNDVVNLMRDKDVNLRRLAADILSGLRDPNTGKALIAALRDADWWVRELAVEALSKIEIGDIRQTLRSMLDDKDPYIRRIATEYFCLVKDPGAFDDLVALLDDEDWWIREKSITALGNIGDPKALKIIARYINDKNVKLVAPEAISRFKTPEAVETLKSFMSNPDSGVRVKVAKASVIIGGAEGEAIARALTGDSEPEVSEEASHALASIKISVYS